MRSFGDIDFDLSIEKVHVKSSINCDAVGVGVENIANNLPIRKGMIRYKLLHTARHLIRDCHKQFSPGIGVELIVDVSFHLRLVPNGKALSGGVDLSDETVHIRVSI